MTKCANMCVLISHQIWFVLNCLANLYGFDIIKVIVCIPRLIAKYAQQMNKISAAVAAAATINCGQTAFDIVIFAFSLKSKLTNLE